MTIRIVELTDPDRQRAVGTLFQRIWQDPQLPVDPPMLRALSHAGNYSISSNPMLPAASAGR